MKKSHSVFYRGSILLNIILIFSLGMYFTQKRKPSGKSMNNKTTQKKHSIAIITPVSVPALQNIEQGFLDTLAEKTGSSYHCTTYNAQGNRTLLRSQIEEVLDNSYDLIFTIGAIPTQLTKTLTEKKNVTTPIVFGGVKDTVAAEFIPDQKNG